MAINQNSTIGFVGIGVMGRSMARNLMNVGYRLHVYTRTESRARELRERGAVWHDSVGELAAVCDVVITMVGFPADVEQVYLGDDGVLAKAKPGTYLIDTTTSRPDLAVRIHADAAGRGIHALDAPVSGGDIGAREARLSIMVGGEPEAYEVVRPLLGLMGSNVVYQGPAGSGQHTKMANQIAIAGTMGANVAGCLAIGLVIGLSARGEVIAPEARLFLATGFCGGFTTMSSFVYETATMSRAGEYLHAAAYAAATLLLSVAAFFAGLAAIRLFTKAGGGLWS